ncbi:MAG: alpha/beta hydrolase [Oscillospiraceae bacterium]|nr:alpha/beta hydrolase [Oscillospiraceae bacterium]
MKTTRRSLTLLCIALVLILAGSAAASAANNSSGSVAVTRISFDTANGTLSGLLYLPKGASAENPRPTVIVTHGYLNSAEMQDANAIELSRRGIVVLALDQYDHGHSDLKNEVYTGTSFMEIWAPFWINSMHDAVAYMYEQPYVLKDADGNGIIGVTGHSMGGFGSTMALAMDEQEFMETGVRKISCGLTEGSDFLYTGFFGVDVTAADALGGGRTLGKVAARYDEFFFNDPEAPEGSVRRKDYVSTPEGMAFLQRTEPAEANTWYHTSDGGKRIIFEPNQTHPWNHFSAITTAHALYFYREAFKDYAGDLNFLDPNDQAWQMKEGFEGMALLGFVMLILAVASLLLQLPVLRKAKTGELERMPASGGGGAKFGSFALLLCLILLPALYFSPLMDGGADNELVKVLFYLGCIFSVSGLVGLIAGLFDKENRGRLCMGSLLVILSGAALAFVTRTPMYQTGAYWTAPGVNGIAYWTIGCALISLLAMSVIYVSAKAKQGFSFRNYGVSFKPLAILMSLIVAILTWAVAYGVLFLMDLIFKTDFRIWTFAFKTFDLNILPAILRYLPTFLLFYVISTASITVNTISGRPGGLGGYLLAIALNAGGAILWLLNQYGTLFRTGVAAHPGSALSGIVLIAMALTLTIAAVISRNLAKKTGNIWLPAFLNTLLMTTMTIANTMVAFK